MRSPHSLRDYTSYNNITNRKYRLTDHQICAALEPFGLEPTGDQLLAIRCYASLLLKWNQRVSLTSIREPKEIVERHFGESMFAASKVPISEGRLADVGSGAGFPGLALKIIRPELHVILIEPNSKKSAFLCEVARCLRLERVQIMRSRAENLKVEPGFCDFVTARAVGKFVQLLSWARTALSERGQVVLWVGATDAERISARRDWKWQEPFLIPGSQRRVLLIGRVVSFRQ